MHRLYTERSDDTRIRSLERAWRRLAAYFAGAGVIGAFLLGGAGLDMLVAGAGGALVALLVAGAQLRRGG